MLSVHAQLHSLRQKGYRGDPIPVIAGEMLEKAYIYAFDEMQVTDVGDAMILLRLFEELIAGGLVVIITSNRPPKDLYKQGLQRELFLPFIANLEKSCLVYHLPSAVDYRVLSTLSRSNVWISPSADAKDPQTALSSALNHFNDRWDEIIGGAQRRSLVGSETLHTQGRPVLVPMVAPPPVKAARFNFSQLCAEAKYAADYQLIATHFPVVFISDIPKLTLSERNEVRRFITLIDIFYEHKVKVVFHAAASVTEIFTPIWRDQKPDTKEAEIKMIQQIKANSNADEVFAFDRTVSRLFEMQSKEYLSTCPSA
jgi:predicted ATPase